MQAVIAFHGVPSPGSSLLQGPEHPGAASGPSGDTAAPGHSLGIDSEVVARILRELNDHTVSPCGHAGRVVEWPI